MQLHDAVASAKLARAAHPQRPATAVIHDTPDARLVVFRISPSQSVAVHTSPSTVVLTVLAGSGVISGENAQEAVTVGDVVTFAPREPHGMTAPVEEMIVLATITPRPGERKAAP